MNHKRMLRTCIVLLPLLSAGCFGNNPATSDIGSDLLSIKKDAIEISVPKSWREVQEDDFKYLGKNVVVAYSSLNYTNGFANNITVTKEPLPQAFTSLEYADANIINSGRFLDDYTKIDEKPVTFKDANNQDIATKMHIFEARMDKFEKLRKYFQLYATQGTIGYTVTVVTTIDEQDTSKFENLLKTFHIVASQQNENQS
jgi:hypothetical protein